MSKNPIDIFLWFEGPACRAITTEKRVAITFHEKPEIKSRESYHKDATYVAPVITEVLSSMHHII